VSRGARVCKTSRRNATHFPTHLHARDRDFEAISTCGGRFPTCRGFSASWKLAATRRNSFLQRPQEGEQVLEGSACQGRPELVAVTGKDLIERRRSTVVEIRPALADAAQRGRVEVRVAHLVGQADVVRFARRVDRRRVATRAVVLLEERSPASHRLLLLLLRKAPQWRCGRECPHVGCQRSQLVLLRLAVSQ